LKKEKFLPDFTDEVGTLQKFVLQEVIVEQQLLTQLRVIPFV
jgi:hypothetical protein